MISFLAIVHLLLHATAISSAIYLNRRQKLIAVSPLPGLSVIIPARNEEKNLKILLPTLLGQKYPCLQIIVYDDDSDDLTWHELESIHDERVVRLKGHGPPEGWVGKVYALYEASRHASGELYLFLDADCRLSDTHALERLVHRFQALPQQSVLTGLLKITGGGLLLVSLVTSAMLGGLPWILVRHFRAPSLSALNGQCWMVPAAVYHRFEPHLRVRSAVLEDVLIGRLFKSEGYNPQLIDVRSEVSVRMYSDFRSAWRGFQKNAYLIMGGHPLPFLLVFSLYVLTFIVAPFISGWFLVSLFFFKFLTDRLGGFPWWVSLLAPLSFLAGIGLQADSAIRHWSDRVTWKGRAV